MIWNLCQWRKSKIPKSNSRRGGRAKKWEQTKKGMNCTGGSKLGINKTRCKTRCNESNVSPFSKACLRPSKTAFLLHLTVVDREYGDRSKFPQSNLPDRNPPRSEFPVINLPAMILSRVWYLRHREGLNVPAVIWVGGGDLVAHPPRDTCPPSHHKGVGKNRDLYCD